MQLGAAVPTATGAVRRRLGAAACALVAAAVPAAARADATPGWTAETSLLLYGEQDRADVVEPVARITRLFGNGHRLSARFAYDAITGASPSGALPSGQLQTTTTPSGNTSTIAAGRIPTVAFRDRRVAVDAEWEAPLLRTLTTTLGARVSNEKDYRSVGGSATFALDVANRLTTLTAGVGYDADEVRPVGGTRLGLSDGTVTIDGLRNAKTVASGLLGVTRVLSRRWLAGVTGSFESEAGYLTEPYKVVSLVDSTTLAVTGQLTEKRPDTRHRASLTASSAYHLERDVLCVSARGYHDDWNVSSGTLDVRYRHELDHEAYLQPHVRYYAQTAARFYVPGLVAGVPLPANASSDYRLGPLRTATVGLTYGFHVAGLPGAVSVRAEYLRQWLAGGGGEARRAGSGEEDDRDRAGPAATTTFDASTIRTNAPALNIGSLLVGYSVHF